MSKDDSLKCISLLTINLEILTAVWKRPHLHVQKVVLQNLLDVRETIRKAYIAEQEPQIESPGEA